MAGYHAEIQADLITNQAPDREVDWELEMDLAGQSRSAYRSRVKFRKYICKSLKSYECAELSKQGRRVIGIWNKGKDGSRPSFTIKPVAMQPLKWYQASNNDCKGGKRSHSL